MAIAGNRTATLERTSLWLRRADLDLLRALYGAEAAGWTHHVRAATATMCDRLRSELRRTPNGPTLLRKLGQDHLP